MKKLLIGLLFLLIGLKNDGQIIHESQILSPSDGSFDFGASGSVAINGNNAIIGCVDDNDNGTKAGAAYIFTFDGTNWVQQIKLLPTDGAAYDQFGYSVDIYGNIAVIGARGDDDNGSGSGSAYIFEYDGLNWIETTKLLPSTGSSNDLFGQSIAIDSNKVVIGAPYGISNPTAGVAYIFEFNGSNWVETAQLSAFDGQATDQFGVSVAISKSKVIIGANLDDDLGTDKGSAYIYEFNGSNWALMTKLLPSNPSQSRWFGRSVAMEENRVIIGQQKYLGQTMGPGAYIYNYDGLNWNIEAGLFSSDGLLNTNFGSAVSLSGNLAVIVANTGSTTLNSGYGIGSNYVYKYNGIEWQEIAQLRFSDTAFLSQDYNVAIDGNNVISMGNKCDFWSYPAINNTPGYIFKVNPKGIFGNIYQDFNQNCIKDTLETGISNRSLLINPGNVIVQTNKGGRWYQDSLPNGNYTITIDTTNNWQTTCIPPYSFTVNYQDSMTFAGDFGLFNNSPCISPSVTVNMPMIRRCFSDQKINLSACNEYNATGILTNGYIDLEVDSLITLTSSSLPYSNLGNGVYRFILSDNSLSPGECEYFWVNSIVSCDANLGQTLCVKANLFPLDSCVFDTIPADLPLDFTPCALPWDHSSIEVKSWCYNDSIHFTVANIGTGNMDCYSPMRLFIDGQYMWLDSLQLLAGEIDTLIFSGDGKTWRLEVDQHPLHPGNSHPNSTIELCGNDSNWTSGLVNILPMDDADPIIDIYCGVVTGSYDPNDKTGYPLGVTDSHYVSPNGKLEYVIRFQNTGTDTAFTVVIRDTLDLDLNIFSVVSGASSHDYSFRMYGPRILEWTFNNILLPDSTIDEPGSNGFVSFEVNQMPNLPDGTEINNEVGIYFDFNAPVITNTTSHIINRNINLPSWSQQLTIIDTSCFNYNFNGLAYSSTGQYYQIYEDTLITLNLLISSPQVEAGIDNFICLNDSVILFGTGAQSYVWNNNVINGVGFSLDTSQLFHVIGTDSLGCSNTDSVFVTVYDTIPSSNFNYTFNGFEITLSDFSSNDVNSWYWTIDGNPIGTGNSIQYLFTQNGNYEVCLIASNECFSDTLCQQIIVTGIGVEELFFNENIKIYPNPTHSFFTIECTELNNSPYEITDITGKIIRSGTFHKKNTTIDLSNEANGFYLLRTNGQTVKLIKQ